VLSLNRPDSLQVIDLTTNSTVIPTGTLSLLLSSQVNQDGKKTDEQRAYD